MMHDFIILENEKSTVTIEKGELTSFKVEGIEYIHQKGSKGWRRSDIEMFPVIGPTVENNFIVHTKKGDATQDQHGLLREMPYTVTHTSNKEARYFKKYQKNALIKNSRFPKKSTEEHLFWPYDFTFKKEYSLKNNTLTIDFILISEKNMPLMLGYHPAFLLSNTGKETIISADKKTPLKEIFEAGSNAFPFLNTAKIVLENIDKKNVEMTTKGFDNFMLWTEVDNLLCIEPITQYTSYTDQKFSEENMRLSKGENLFSVAIKIL